MRWPLSILFLYITCLPLFAGSGQEVELLLELDQAVRSRDIYHTEKQTKISHLKEQLPRINSDEERYRICNELFMAYRNYQTDSALHYIHEKKRIANRTQNVHYQNDTKINLAEIMCVMGMYKEALDILDSIPRSTLSDNLIEKYYQQYHILYGQMADYAITGKEDYLLKTSYYRDSILQLLDPHSVNHLLTTSDQHAQGDIPLAEVMKQLMAAYPVCQDIHSRGLIAYNLSEAYRRQGNQEMQKHYLILSSLADLQCAIKEYISLRILAQLLYEEGDIDRAYNYLHCSMEDAIFCNARLRTIEVSRIYPIIDKAYQMKAEQESRRVRLTLIGISMLALCLVVAIFFGCRQMKRLNIARRELSRANNCLKEMNKTLSETSAIKEEYIAQYLDQCMVYIDKMDEYRRSLAKLAMASRLDELFKAIKSDTFIEKERKTFYTGFDHTFLNLFPNFVESFNALLLPGERIVLKPSELLNTELRIFALIRLGITDSTRIAGFLRYSVTTIYNYRSKMRHRSLSEPNQFENEVMRIGSLHVFQLVSSQ